MQPAGAPPPATIDPQRRYSATVRTAAGEIVFQLDPAAAPVTVNNFVHLARSGFYAGLTFHRVEPGFVVQGGDPDGNGTGGPGYRLPDETTQAAWTKGSVGMASSRLGVNGSQFFVLLADAPYLATSGVYNHFGRVASGQDVVERIRPSDAIEAVEISES